MSSIAKPPQHTFSFWNRVFLKRTNVTLVALYSDDVEHRSRPNIQHPSQPDRQIRWGRGPPMSTGDLKHLFLLFFTSNNHGLLRYFWRNHFFIDRIQAPFSRWCVSIGKCKTQMFVVSQLQKYFSVFIHHWQLFATLGQNFKQSGDKNFHICRLNVRIHFGW